MKIILPVLLIAVFACQPEASDLRGLAAQSNEGKSPASKSSPDPLLACRPQFFNFGSVNPGQFGLSNRFLLTNKTNDVIDISMKTSHKALTVSMPQTRLEAGAQALLDVTLDPELLSPGAFHGAAELSAGGKEAVLSIPLSATVDPWVQIRNMEGWPKKATPQPPSAPAGEEGKALVCRPQSFDFGSVNPVQFGLSHEFSVMNVADKPVEITRVAPSVDALGAWMPQTHLPPGSSAALKLFFNPQSIPPGPFEGRIELYAGRAEAILSVRVAAFVDAEVAGSPAETWAKTMPEGPTPSVTPQELMDMLSRREPMLLGFFGSDKDFNKERIPGAVHAKLADVRGWFADVDRSRKIVLYAAGVPPGPSPGMRSAIATLRQEMGFKDVSCLAGTIAAWKAAGYPLEHGAPGDSNSKDSPDSR